MGDIRAFLARAASPPAARDIEQAAGTTHLADHTPFDPQRARYWQAIREAYPTRNAGACVAGLKRKVGESGHVYIARARTMWADGFGNPPEQGSAEEVMLRAAIIIGLPADCQTKLKYVVGLARLDPGDWQETVCHSIEREQEKEDQADEKSRKVQRRLAEIQLQEATKRLNDEKKTEKGKLKTASILTVSAPLVANLTQQPQSPQAQWPAPKQAPPVYQQQGPQQGYDQGYAPQQQYQNNNQGYRSSQHQGGYQARPGGNQGSGGRGQGGPRPQMQQGPQHCFHCDSPNHWVRDCPQCPNN